MDTLMGLLIIVIFVGLIILKINLPTIKGKIGEMSVSATLSFLPENEYIVLNDLMFKNGNSTTQIDHIVVSVHGIFVIETKNYKGWIYGNSNNDYWTQNIYGYKYSLYNPILQNQNHIKFLIHKFDVIRDIAEYVYPVVVFLGASDLRISGNDNCVLWRSQLNYYIKSCQQNIMSIEDCRNIASVLEIYNLTDKEQRKQHKRNVKAAMSRHENKVANGICPRCGANLVVRNGSYGEFLGCSNYPRCRYTR